MYDAEKLNALEEIVQGQVAAVNSKIEPDREPPPTTVHSGDFVIDVSNAIAKYHNSCADHILNVSNEVKNILESVIKQCEGMAADMRNRGKAQAEVTSDALLKARGLMKGLDQLRESFSNSRPRRGKIDEQKAHT